MPEPTNAENEKAANAPKRDSAAAQASALQQAQAADRLIAQAMFSRPAEASAQADLLQQQAQGSASVPAAASGKPSQEVEAVPLEPSEPKPLQVRERGAAPQQRECIDDAAIKKMMKASEPTFMEKYGSCLVTFVLIAINVVVFVVEMILSGFSASISGKTLYNMGAMYAPGIGSAADLYRFVTPMFLHVDVMHLLFNMAALYSAGVLLEYLLGRWNFLLLYFIAGITGNVVSYAADIVTGSYAISAGASTSIFGLFVAIALLGVLSKRNRSYLMNYSKGMLSVIAINIVYTLLMPSVSLSGHLGGAIGGLIGMFIVPSKNLRVPAVVRVIVGVLWVVVAAAFMTASFTGFWPLSFLK